MTARLTDAELDKLERVHLASLTGDPDAVLMLQLRTARALPLLLAEVREVRAKLARVEGYRERLAAALEDDDRVIAGGGDLDGALHEAAEHARRGGFDAAIFGKDGE